MKDMGKWLLVTGPLLLLAGLQTAQARTGAWDGLGDLGGWCCRLFGGDCTPHSPTSGPTAVPEPQMIALFSVSVVSAGIAAYRRRRKQR